MREFSWLAILLGVVIGAALAAANAFVGLQVGMTISASIPAAVMSLLILRTLLKRGTLLESNMVQTIGSAGESVATGMIFVIPALFILGENAAYLDMVIWGAIGGLLGVCFMVPLRKVLIVKEHGTLPFPEGVACAEVLESGERGGAGAKSVLWGAIVGGVYHFLASIGIFKDTGTLAVAPLKTEFQLDSSPALLGVGYILGIRISAYMLAGAVLGWFVLIPAIAFFGAGSAAPVFPEKELLIGAMSPYKLYDNYVRYIGAGAVAIGGLLSLLQSFPTIASSLWHIATGLFSGDRGVRTRTEKDFPFPLLLVIIVALGYAMWHFDQVKIGHIGAIAVVVFTFFFVTVSSRLVGLVGSSSNPISGMTIATLLGTALVYKLFVMGGQTFTDTELTGLKVTCLSIGAIVCVAISVAGDTSQDLKTGYLVKATPWKQQAGEMIGVLTSVLVVAAVLLLLNSTHGFTSDRPDRMLAPQANLMKVLVDGVIGGEVPWTLIMIGGAVAVIIEMLGLPALPFAVGLYLPLGLSTPIMVGGLIRWWFDRKRKEHSEHEPGTLTSAGLVAGVGLMGVALAGVAALISWWFNGPKWANPITGGEAEPVMPSHVVPWLWSKFASGVPGEVPGISEWGLSHAWWNALPMIPFVFLAIWLFRCARKRPRVVLPPGAGAPIEPFAPEPSPTEGMPPGPPDSGTGSATPPAINAAATDTLEPPERQDADLVAEEDGSAYGGSSWSLDLPKTDESAGAGAAGESGVEPDVRHEGPALADDRDADVVDDVEVEEPHEDEADHLDEADHWYKAPGASADEAERPTDEPDGDAGEDDPDDDPYRPNPDERF